MEFQVSITGLHDPRDPIEIDCVISAEPEHRVADLSAALRSLRGPGAAAPAALWLGTGRLPEDQPLTASGIRAGARLGLGGPSPAAGRAARLRPGDGAVSAGGPGQRVTELRVVSGPDAGLVVPLPPGEHILGRQGTVRLESTVRPEDAKVSRRHCVLTVAADGATYTLGDLGSTNGTGLDGKRVGTDPVPVRAGQLIGVGRDVLTIVTPGAQSAISLRPDPVNPFGLLVNRQMRAAPALPAPVVIEAGTGARGQSGGLSWLPMLISLGVSLASGAVLGAVSHQWMFLLVGLVGPVATLSQQLLSRRNAAGQARVSKRQLAADAQAAATRLADSVTAEERARRAALPDPATLGRIATEPGTRLWERTPADEDFLRLRFGTGDLPASTVTVRGAAGTPDGPGQPVVRDVPVAADLAALGVLGIAGPPSASLPALAWAVAQLAVLHAPGDLRLVLCTEDPRAWQWTRWLPHLRPVGDPGGWLSVGTDAGTRTKRVTELRELIGSRRATGTGGSGGYGVSGGYGSGGYGSAGYGSADYGGGTRGGPLPHVVVIIDGSAGVRDIPGIDQVLYEGPAAGVSVIIRDHDARELPGACAARLDTNPAAGGTGGYTEVNSGTTVPVRRLDTVSVPWADEIARALAPLGDQSSVREAQRLGTVRLKDLWGLDQLSAPAVENLWRQEGGPRTAVPLGRLADGSTFVLDIARQGPHMLVGGTTRSGKSQFLQTFVASLMLGSTPQALNFVLIDYKGGLTFQPFQDLPHVTGYLTDLNEHLGKRALTALEAETRYRERLISESGGCQNLEEYRAAGEPKGRLPRLLVIADEFRFLKESMPEVLKGMTDLAARGGALGIHLVLATQSPAKAITEDIRDNTKLRVCFRVEEKEGSLRVIDIPDACEIDPDLKGRGFARLYGGAVAQFQGAWASAPAAGDPVAGSAQLRATARPFETVGAPMADLAAVPDRERPAGTGPTDLSKLVKAVHATGWRPPEHRAWLEPLPALIPLASLPVPTGDAPAHAGGPLRPVPYGMADLPDEQAQEPLVLDLDRGSNVVIGGAAMTGRTTALRAIAAGIAAGCSPADVHLYALDCDKGELGPLARLPHCGAVVRHTDAQRASRLLDRLEAELDRRRDLLADGGFASVAEQRGRVPASARLPYLVLLIDGWDTFTGELGQVDYGRLVTTLNRLLSQGASAGLRVIVTGGLAALTKLAGSCPERIVLRLSGPTDLATANVPKGTMPASPGPGRGVLLPAAHEVQLAFAGRDPSGTAQTTAMNELIGAARSAFPAVVPAPLRVDALPSRIPLAKAAALPGWAGREALRPAVALGGDELGWLGPDLRRAPGFAITGPAQSGKSTALAVLAESLLASGASVIGLAPRPSPLRALAGRPGMIGLFTDEKPDAFRLLDLLKGADGPRVVLADDADLLTGQPNIEELFSVVLSQGREEGMALAVAATPAQLGRPARNFMAGVREYRTGLLLTPEDTQQPVGLFGVRLERSAVFSRPAGRGFLIQQGQAMLVQVAEVAEV